MTKVLVVDDVEEIRELVQILLISEGFDTQTCETVREAKDFLQKQTVDVVITDLRMPDESGFKLIEALTSEANQNRPKILAMSGGGRDLHISQQDNNDDLSKTDGFISKPFTKEDLTDAIQRALGT